MTRFVRTVQSEWLKLRRSAAIWLVLLAAAFTPSIILTARVVRRASLPAIQRASDFWLTLWRQSNQAVAVFLLPVFAILLTSLVVQIEWRNNTWKQLHASPQTLPRIFAAKLVVIVAALIAFFVLSNVAVYLVGVAPALIFPSVPFPAERFPLALYAARSLSLFIDALPVVMLQYALALHFKNFSVPLGIGMGLWVAAVGALGWRYIYVIPYGYSAMDFFVVIGERRFPGLPLALGHLALGFSAILGLAGLLSYANKSDRG